MARITISDLDAQTSDHPLHELDDRDSALVYGGSGSSFDAFLNYGIKSLQFVLIGYAIQQIVLLATSFLGAPAGNNSSNSTSLSSGRSSGFNLLSLFNFGSGS